MPDQKYSKVGAAASLGPATEPAQAAAQAAQMSAEELAQASGDPADNYTQDIPEARAATIARVRADDPAVVTVNWRIIEPDDAEVVALCAALDGSTHVQELNLSNNDKLTEVAFQAVLGVVPKSRLGTVNVENDDRISDELQQAIEAATTAAAEERLRKDLVEASPDTRELDAKTEELRAATNRFNRARTKATPTGSCAGGCATSCNCWWKLLFFLGILAAAALFGGAYRAWAEEDGQIPTMTWVLGGLGLAVLVMQMVLFVLTTLVRINCTVTRRSAETSA